MNLKKVLFASFLMILTACSSDPNPDGKDGNGDIDFGSNDQKLITPYKQQIQRTWRTSCIANRDSSLATLFVEQKSLAGSGVVTFAFEDAQVQAQFTEYVDSTCTMFKKNTIQNYNYTVMGVLPKDHSRGFVKMNRSESPTQNGEVVSRILRLQIIGNTFEMAHLGMTYWNDNQIHDVVPAQLPRPIQFYAQ